MLYTVELSNGVYCSGQECLTYIEMLPALGEGVEISPVGSFIVSSLP